MNVSMESLLARFDRGWKSVHWACGVDDCHNKLFLRSVPQSRVGIRMNNLWYCSVDCFVRAARDRFSVMTSRRNFDMPHRPRVTLGSILLSKGYLSEEDYRGALNQCHSSGEALEAMALRTGLVDEWQIASARATQWGYPVLARDRSSHTVDADLPLTLMKAFSAVPLHYSKSADRILVGFVLRVEHSLLHSLEQATGCRVEACFITPTELREQMQRLELRRDSREVVLEDSMTPIQFGKLVGGFALETMAKNVSVSSCQDFVWMRLSGKQRMTDVLFRGRRGNSARTCDTSVETSKDICATG